MRGRVQTRACWLVVAVALVAIRAAAFANPTDADELLRQGVEMRRRGEDEAALKLFERANQAQPSPQALAQIGLAEQAIGRWLVAFEHLQRALEASRDRWLIKNRSLINQAFDRVQDHVGLLEILDGPPGAEVRLDGARRGTLPLGGPLPAMIGTVTIELVAPGMAPIRRATIIRGHETTRESFHDLARPPTGAAAQGAPPNLVPSSVPAPGPATGIASASLVAASPPAPLARKTTALPRWLAWVAAGTTVALVAGAIILRADANKQFDDLKNTCGTAPAGCSAGQIDGVKSRDRTTTILSVLGGVAAVATGVTIVVNGEF